ncbi:conjugative transposon protein TraM [Mucilaginibacter paludis]|uniref:Conjugative transposon TraM protein n=1 Tax=Mucilaginibacter paludis DSM 18603 TaxID=714943 RepID=H1YIB6_9SPHI|nr:conjugative transposon protein TraM [Mucilaginibacter paludis]EHQ27529.1 conjugative transposon TraM protein [Mucilaginibacter paludis DSM 18603]
MKEQTIEQQQQQEKLKKFLLVLPLLILPFMTMAFWALGGGKGGANEQAAHYKGINTDLPEAKFNKDQPQDKLSLYDQAARDSVTATSHSANPVFTLKQDSSRSVLQGQSTADANEVKLSQKLAQLKQEINKAPEPMVTANQVTAPKQQPVTNTADVDRLENLMKNMNTKNGDDPEMKQLEGMIDKIIQIQHPEMVAAQLQQQGKQAKPATDSLFKAIPAMIDGNQNVAQGSAVKLRLQDTVTLKGITLPKGFNLYGNCAITNQRLLLQIKSIRLGTSIIPVDLTVYYTDGMPGLPAPEAELADAGGNGAANAVQSMEFLPYDQSLTTQVASAGISAAKTLFSKKVKRIRVKLKDGEGVLLRNNQPGH